MPVSFENRNFQKELDKKLELIKKEEKVPTLLLHSCCAPCSSYVIEYLSDYFNITVFYYNRIFHRMRNTAKECMNSSVL